MTDLFQNAGLESEAPRPLADRLRPQSLKEVVGQDHLLGEDGFLGAMVCTRANQVRLFSGGRQDLEKPLLPVCLANETDLHFEQISAIFSGVKELREVFDQPKKRRVDGLGTLLFIDEIHRFNKSQQDSFLPHLEDGTIILVGATTENPSFELKSGIVVPHQCLDLQAH